MSVTLEYYDENILGERPHLASFAEIKAQFSAEMDFCDDEHIGSYRMSQALLNKIMQPNHRTKEHVYSGITKTELTILLMLLQIADNTGYVDALHYTEFVSATDSAKTPLFTTKSYYNALNGLKNKGFISFDVEWGCRNIHILHNSIGSHERYLSLNYDSFTPGTVEHDAFFALPLGAQKLYLYLLANFHPRFGYSANIKQLQKIMGLKTDYLIPSYLKKLEPLLGPISRVKSKRSRKKNDNLHLNLVNRLKMVKKDGLSKNQLSYFGRTFARLLRHYGIDLDRNNFLPYQYYKSEFFRLVSENAKMGPKNIFKVIEYALSQQGVLNHQALSDVKYILANAR